MQDASSQSPVVSPTQILPEITLKAVVLGIILAILLGASNAFLALKIGTTVAASIPASVIALAVFRFFKRSNILETNLVQTAASAGEGLAAASTFILPALLILGYWAHFKFWETLGLTLFGGILGVLFSIPLRRIFLNQLHLPFPEGTAVGNVLRASTAAGAQLKNLIKGSLAGGLIVISQTGLQVVSAYFPLWFHQGKLLWGVTLGFDPTLIGAGYIIGINANMALFLGMVVCWVIGVPFLCYFYGLPAGDTPYDQVMSLWSTKIRYIGVGTMVVGGIWTLITLFRIILKGVVAGFKSLKNLSKLNEQQILRTDFDIPIKYILVMMLTVLVLSFFLILSNQLQSGLPLTMTMMINLALICILSVLILGFFSALICGYLVGLIGSTNTPMSGVMIINLLLMAFILFPLLTARVDVTQPVYQHAVIAMAIFVLALIGSSAVITIENIQDLKAGQMVGATPWKQQVMMFIGVLASSLVIAPIMNLLFQAYGMGGVYPHSGMDPAQMLAAPQAALLTSLAQGVLGHDLPWAMLIFGGIFGFICIAIDYYLNVTRGQRLAVLAVGLGAYLPPEIITPCVFGGLIHYFATKAIHRKTSHLPAQQKKLKLHESYQQSTLLACGLVAGSALMGVILAIPFVILGSADALSLSMGHFQSIANVLGFIVAILLGIWLYRATIGIDLK